MTAGRAPARVATRTYSPPREEAIGFARPRIIDSLVFVLLLSGPPRLRTRDATAALRADIDWAVLVELAVWGAACLWLFVRLYPLLITRGLVPRVWPPQIIGGLFVASLFSSAWLAPGVAPTLYSIVQFGVMLGFCWTFVRYFGPETYLKHMLLGYVLLAVAVLVAWMLMPELVVRRGRVRGDLIAPAGAVASLGLVIALAGAHRLGRRALAAVVAILFVVLAVAQTRTAFVAFFGFVLIAWVYRCPSPIRRAAPFVVALGIAAALFQFLPGIQQYLVREEESISTLSARLPLWTYLVGITLSESPLIGLGYQSAVRILAPQFLPRLGDAHSVFIEVFVGGGIFGFVLFSLLYGSLVVYAVRMTLRWRWSHMALSVVGLFVVTAAVSITNTQGLDAGPVGFTFWSLTALFPALNAQLRATTGPSRLSPSDGATPR